MVARTAERVFSRGVSMLRSPLAAVPKARARALTFAALLAAFYGALYAILQLEDVAL